jgi:hypothetical protein
MTDPPTSHTRPHWRGTFRSHIRTVPFRELRLDVGRADQSTQSSVLIGRRHRGRETWLESGDHCGAASWDDGALVNAGLGEGEGGESTHLAEAIRERGRQTRRKHN